MVDTEYSILDALFYPWMKDINSPWWYRPDKVYSDWATPYPMATLEVQRPRMRYASMAQSHESRNDTEYTYYSYKFIGIKPTSYSSFEVNGSGRSNLLRSLTLISDMCLVDLTGDVAGSGAGSTNLGNRSSFVFGDSSSSSGESNEDDESDEEDEDDWEEEEEELEDEYEDYEDWEEENYDDMEQ